MVTIFFLKLDMYRVMSEFLNVTYTPQTLIANVHIRCSSNCPLMCIVYLLLQSNVYGIPKGTLGEKKTVEKWYFVPSKYYFVPWNYYFAPWSNYFAPLNSISFPRKISDFIPSNY